MLSGAFPAIDVVRLFAIVFIAICLVPAGGHLAEIPNKIALPPGKYMIVQKFTAAGHCSALSSSARWPSPWCIR
jgi:hypothetical protein